MKSMTKIDEAEKIGCTIVVSGIWWVAESWSHSKMKYVVLAFAVALGTLAIAQPTHAAACANGVYRAGCVGPNGAAVVHKAPRTKPHSVSCANGVYLAG